MFKQLKEINDRPRPFEFYTATELWTDEHTSEQMLKYHLNETVDLSSRRAEFIARSARWIVSRFEVGPGKRLADFGCGPGLYATRLARTGAEVTGIDFSARSIHYAEKTAAEEGLSIEYVNQDYLTVDLGRQFDLITMIMCDFCALSPDQRRRLLGVFRKHLRPGGAILLDVYSLPAFAEREESATYEKNLLDGFWSADEYFGFLNTFKYENEKVMLDKYTIVESDRVRTVYNWLQYFTPEDLKREFAECDLAVAEVLGDVAGGPLVHEGPEFAVVAEQV